MTSQDLVLFLQVGHLSSQVLASNGRQQGKNRMQNRVHRAIVAIG